MSSSTLIGFLARKTPYPVQQALAAVAHPITEYQIAKAKNRYRKTHPNCALCSAKGALLMKRKNDVHHLRPVHVSPERSCDQDNLITLCRRHHFWVGHMGNWSDYNCEVPETIQALQDAYGRWATLVRA